MPAVLLAIRENEQGIGMLAKELANGRAFKADQQFITG